MRSPSGPIVLVGLSGAGKTVVGRLLAQRLAYRFLDLDSEVVEIEVVGQMPNHVRHDWVQTNWVYVVGGQPDVP